MNSTTVPTTEADVRALAPAWADVEASDIALREHPLDPETNVLWIARNQIQSDRLLVNISRLDILVGPDASIRPVCIQAFVDDRLYGDRDLQITDSALARRLAWALFTAADDLDEINGASVPLPVRHVDTVSKEDVPYVEVKLNSAFSAYPHFIDKQDDEPKWQVNPTSTDDDSVSVADARIYVQEIISAINLADRFNRDLD